MQDIVLATPEQVEKIRAISDLGPGCSVYAMGNDLAVLRTAVELDPVHFDEGSSHSRRALFLWGMQNIMRANGIPHYYFNVTADDLEWQKVVENYGSQRISKSPEFRYKKLLLNDNQTDSN